MVIEGIRTEARQQLMVQKKASTTLNSRHLLKPCMVGDKKVHHVHAVDLGAMIGTKLDWTWELYEDIAKWMKIAAKEEGVPIEWGGDWIKLRDGPHFQLPWKSYPILQA